MSKLSVSAVGENFIESRHNSPLS